MFWQQLCIQESGINGSRRHALLTTFSVSGVLGGLAVYLVALTGGGSAAESTKHAKRPLRCPGRRREFRRTQQSRALRG